MRRTSNRWVSLLAFGFLGFLGALAVLPLQPWKSKAPGDGAPLTLKSALAPPKDVALSSGPEAPPPPGTFRIVGRIVKALEPLKEEDRESEAPDGRPTVPLPGASVTLRMGKSSNSRIAGPDGRFEFSGVPPSKATHELLVDEPSCAVMTAPWPIFVEGDSDPVDVGDVVLEPAQVLVAQVRDPVGNPVDGARLWADEGVTEFWVDAESGAESGRVPPRAVPAGGADYEFRRLEAGHYRIVVFSSGHALLEEWVDVPRAEPVRLVLREEREFRGRVLALGGEPIQGAEVGIEWEGAFNVLRARSGADGRIRIGHLEDSEYGVKVSAEAFSSVWEIVRADETEVEFWLVPAATVAGTVVRKGDASPIEGACVSFHRPEFSINDQDYEGTTDARGAFELKEILPGDYEVFAGHDEYVPSLSVPIQVGQGSRVTGLTFALEEGFARILKVVDAASNAPVRAARVVLKCPRTETHEELSRECTTDESGAARVTGLGELTCSAKIWAPGYVPVLLHQVAFRADDPAETVIPIGSGGSISGRVLDPEARPIAGAAVIIGTFLPSSKDDREEYHALRELIFRQHEPLKTDSMGCFSFKGLPEHPGYLLEAAHEDFVTVRTEEIAVRSGKGGVPLDIAGLDLVLPRGGSVEGRLLDPQLEPVVGTVVCARRLDPMWKRKPGGILWLPSSHGPESASSTTGGGGEFKLPHLAPGKYLLTAAPKGWVLGPSREVEILEGRNLAGVDLVIEAGEILEGRVVAATGEPVEAAEVHLVDWGHHVTTHADGRFRFDGLESGGKCLVLVTRRGFAPRSVRAVQKSPVEVVLERLAKIRGRLVATGQYLLPRGKIWVGRWQDGEWMREEKETDITGRFEFEVPAGRCELEADIRGFPRPGKELRLSPGEIATVTIELKRAGLVRGKVLDKVTGEPVSGDVEMAVETPDGRRIEKPDSPSFSRGEDDVPGEIISETHGAHSFSFEVPEGPFVLVARHCEYRPWRLGGLAVAAGQVLDFVIELEKGRGIDGRVAFEGRPVADALVVAARGGDSPAREETRTGEDGRFEIVDFPAGECEVKAVAALSGAREIEKRTRIEGEWNGYLRVDFELSHPRLAGRVLSDGRPVPGVRVTVDSEFEAHVDTTTDSSGQYSLELPAAGTYSVKAWRVLSERGYAHGYVVGIDVEVEIEVPEGTTEIQKDLDIPAR